MRRYLCYLLRLAQASVRGTVRGSLNWGPIIGAAIFGAALSLGHQTDMPAIFTDGLQGVVLSAIVFSSIAWIFFFITRFLFVAPFSLLKITEDRLSAIEESMRANIRVAWRFAGNEFSEIMLVNQSLKSLPGIEVSFRNYRDADGSNIRDVLCTMNSVDGKGPRVQLDPIVQIYFRFAKVSRDSDGRAFIELTPTGRETIKIDTKECGVKFTVSGGDIPASTIDLRLLLNEDGAIQMEPWETKGKAVNPASPDGA